MPADGREYSARDLTARWLSVEEVLGRRPVRGVAWSAGEYEAARSGSGDKALELRRPEPREREPRQGEHREPKHREPESYRSEPRQPAHPKLPPPDLVAADTDFASRWFTADPTPGRLAGRTVVLPFVAVAELATWPERLLWSHPRGEELSVWTDPRRMILGDDTVCRIWARIAVAAQRAGSPTPAHDSWVAAGCLSYGLPLAALNKRRYQYFAERYGLRLV